MMTAKEWTFIDEVSFPFWYIRNVLFPIVLLLAELDEYIYISRSNKIEKKRSWATGKDCSSGEQLNSGED